VRDLALVDPCRRQRMAIDPDQGALAPSPAMMQPITPDTLRSDCRAPRRDRLSQPEIH
jgi:O2-independent ubiquinone biosynthesis accessory factor UbiT